VPNMDGKSGLDISSTEHGPGAPVTAMGRLTRRRILIMYGADGTYGYLVDATSSGSMVLIQPSTEG